MEALRLNSTFDSSSSLHPKPQNLRLNYGTAGFRDIATVLDSTVFRCGVIAGMRSHLCGKPVGLMITASHNPEQDNGVKMIEWNGEMLIPAWEQHATAVANAESSEELSTVLNRVIGQEGIRLCERAAVVIGGDTRDSTASLMQAAREGVQATDADVIDIGICTTPMLHYQVVRENDSSLQDYYQRVVNGFTLLTSGEECSTRIFLDCANGVGSLPARAIVPLVKPLGLQLSILNAPEDPGQGEQQAAGPLRDPPPRHEAPSATDTTAGRLNHLCGSDFVQVGQQWPQGLTDDSARGALCASLDGDADRVVFYFSSSTPACSPNGSAHELDVGAPSAAVAAAPVLLDGDYIAALVATYMIEVVNLLPLQEAVSVGVVQTAYANGASTAYLQAQGVSVALALTGVKHLHESAKRFDVGVYYEANGHGSVVFSPRLPSLLKECPAEHQAVQCMHALMEVVNPAVGDGISNLLLVSGILAKRRMTLHMWRGLYSALPSRLSKLRVRDRLVLHTTCMDTRLTTPPELQSEIDTAVADVSAGRAFVRPSGTEDVVRVYAEASTQVEADRLALQVLKSAHRLAGGVGEVPTSV